jgi:hypothetical protein
VIVVSTAGSEAYGIRTPGGGEVRGNTIEIDGTSSHWGVDVTSTTAAVPVTANRILLATGTNTYGIRTANAGAVRNNVIESFGTTAGYGVSVTAGAAPIQNNTITFGDAAILLSANPGGALIENNILLGTSQSGAFCILVNATTARPTQVRHNDFYDCGSGGVYSDAGTAYAFVCPSHGGAISISCGGTSLTTPAAVNNYADNPVLTVDYALQASSPASVRTGGNTLGAVTDDIAGTPRTAPYSIGAYEYD